MIVRSLFFILNLEIGKFVIAAGLIFEFSYPVILRHCESFIILE